MATRIPAKSLNPWRVLVACALFLVAPATWAAPTLTGVVLSGVDGQPVRGAAIEVDGLDAAATSDLNGLVAVDVESGTYTVTIKMGGFKTQKVTGVEVDGGGGNFAAVLEPSDPSRVTGSAVLEEITVSAEADLAGQAALLAERRNAVQISDSIGSEEMGKNTGSDAAGALKRVTGISLHEGKFAYVRGLGDRYSNTELNGSRLPSTEFERKVVPLDLFPADLIEKITVSKSYTVDKPGDFAAGFIELETVNLPVRQTASIGIGGDWNSVTTGGEYLEFGGGLSFSGGGGQPLPSSVPSTPVVRSSPFSDTGFTPAELEELGEQFLGDWSPERKESAAPNLSFKGSYGNSAGKIGFILSANYENSFQNRFDEQTTFYRVGSDGGVVPNNRYTFDTTNEKVRQALTGSIAYRLSDNSHLRFRSLYTTLADAESRDQAGFASDFDTNIKDFRVSYLDQEITNFQLAGDHYLAKTGPAGSLLEWSLSRSDAATEENRRETLYQEIREGEFLLTDNAQSSFMFFNNLEDKLGDAKVDWTTFWNGERTFGSLKVGGAYTQSERSFDGRRLRFFQRGTAGIDLSLRPEEIFTAENIDAQGFEITEITRPSDAYTGDHEIVAGYGQVDLGWGDWRFIGGVRVEDSTQKVITFNQNFPDAPPVLSDVINTDVLPSLALVYKLTDDQNLRFSASRTLNRPEYRELAPFRFSHVVGGYSSAGNPDLERAKITSFDARWEWFPAAADVIAASVFYKDFENPIEGIILTGAELIETFDNVEGAENFGIELEIRRNLGFLSEKLHGLTGILNYSFVESEIQIDPATTVFTNAKRALVGQPDNVINAILEWDGRGSGSLVRLLFNFTGDKISRAGGFGLPDVIEEARQTVDLVWAQDLGRWAPGLTVKLSGSNLLDEERLWTQGGETFRLYNSGRGISFSLGYKPFAR